ncbi:MAG: ribonuclease III [Fibrobacterota bacterium]|nr:ribonuclease III [Fibrobacterota bacterium]QQS05586.1 MAG: ribonuclease III [Fibrobacterota bacterium]
MTSVLPIFQRLASRFARLVGRQGGGEHRLAALEKAIGHVFTNTEHLERAMAHRSWVNSEALPPIESNERLEFLGDAVLDMVVTDFLYATRPDEDEGKLSKIKGLVVSAKVLAEVARGIAIGEHLKLSRSEERGGGRDRESILADAFESVIGAIYLDAGYHPARAFLMRTLVSSFDRFLGDQELANYKSALLEHSQSKGWGAPHYEVERTEGPEHGKRYHVLVRVRGDIWGRGNGPTKKDAEQAAAREALQSRGIHTA